MPKLMDSRGNPESFVRPWLAIEGDYLTTAEFSGRGALARCDEGWRDIITKKLPEGNARSRHEDGGAIS